MKKNSEAYKTISKKLNYRITRFRRDDSRG
jgi:hypothetical protein